MKSTKHTYTDGTIKWINNFGQLHREDGPAIEYCNGTKMWYLNGKFHREDGPAIEYANGNKEWWFKDELHREDGPAVKYADGTKYWYVNGTGLTEEEVNKRILKKNLLELL